MYWQDEPQASSTTVPDDVVDVVYAIQCVRLPVDHAQVLSLAIQQQLPWFATEERAALHTIHVAESGNGWVRPDDFIHVSRRTKLTLRVPKHRIDDAQQLSGKVLDLGGHPLTVGTAVIRPLSTLTTIFARYVTAAEGDEQQFLRDVLAQLKTLSVQPKKMLCGMEKSILVSGGALRTRSLMLANLSVDESLTLQHRGLGSHRQLGCGVFIPHKDIQELK